MARLVSSFLFIALLLHFVLATALADDAVEARLAAVESRVNQLQSQVANLPTSIQTHRPTGAALFLFGAFCALWAQNTNRNPWLWFFLGMIFSVITVIVLLSKNANDRTRRPRKEDVDFLSD